MDPIGYSAEMLIEAAAQLNYDVLAIACHERVVCGQRLAAYAQRRGVLLIPAIEILVEGKHVVVLNPTAELVQVRTFDGLRGLDRSHSVVLAPHPFHLRGICLGQDLITHADLFDAVEYSSFYFRGLDLNRRAVDSAKAHGKPVIGTSDAHTFPYRDSTFTWIEAEPTVEGVMEAVREGRVTVETRPQPLSHAAKMVGFSACKAVRLMMKRPAKEI